MKLTINMLYVKYCLLFTTLPKIAVFILFWALLTSNVSITMVFVVWLLMTIQGLIILFVDDEALIRQIKEQSK